MKVLCINDSRPPSAKHFQQWVEVGETYTVTREEGSLYQGKRYLLKELKNKPVWVPELMTKCEPGFSASRFIEITDIVGEEIEVNIEELVV